MQTKRNRKEILNELNQLETKYQNNIFFSNKINQLKNEINNLEPYIVIVGQFSVGKSEFINALLKERLLSAHSKETTKIITKIKQSETENLEVEFTDGRKELVDLNEETIKQYTTFDGEKSKDVKEIIIYKNLQFLDEDVSIVDSPGLNSMNEGAFETTNNLLKYASAVVYLFNIQKGLDAIDDEMLDKLTKMNTNIILVGNKKDVISTDSLQEVLVDTKEKIYKYNLKDIYTVSARQAMEGYQDNAIDKVNISQIKIAKQAINDYVLSGKAMEDQENHITSLFNELVNNINEFEEAFGTKKNNLNQKLQRLIKLTEIQYDELLEMGKQRINERKTLLKDINSKFQQDINRLLLDYNKNVKKEVANKRESMYKSSIVEINFEVATKELNELITNLANDENRIMEKLELLYKKYINIISELVNEDREEVVITLKNENDNISLEWNELKFKNFKVNQNVEINIEELISNFDEEEKEIDIRFKRRNQIIDKEIVENRKKINYENDKYYLIQNKIKNNKQKVKNIPKYEEKEIKEKVFFFFNKTTTIDNRAEIEEKVRNLKDESAILEKENKEIKKNISMLNKQENELNYLKKDNFERLNMQKDELKNKVVDEFSKVFFDKNSVIDKKNRLFITEIKNYWQEIEYNTQEQYDNYLKYYRQEFESFVTQNLEKEIKKIKGLTNE